MSPEVLRGELPAGAVYVFAPPFERFLYVGQELGGSHRPGIIVEQAACQHGALASPGALSAFQHFSHSAQREAEMLKARPLKEADAC